MSDPDGTSSRLPDGTSSRLPDDTSSRLPDDTSSRLPDGTSSRLPDGTSSRLPDGTSSRLPGRGAWLCLGALLALNALVICLLWPTLTRPLWYDEAWRAFHVSIRDGWFDALTTTNAPLPAGWYALERLSVAAFGHNKVALRLPDVLALPACTLATYRLGRWWLPRPGATLVAAGVTVNAPLLVYGLQLKPYVLDATCAAAAVHLWLAARERSDTGRRVWPCQAGLAVCGVLTLTSALVLAPLLATDVMAAAVRWLGARRPEARRARGGPAAGGSPAAIWPGRAAWRLVAGDLVVGAVTALHLVVFVLPQAYLTGGPGWSAFFITRHNAARQIVTATWDFPENLMTAALTRADGQFGSPFLGSPLLVEPRPWLRWTVVAGLLAGWAVGAAVALRTREGRGLLLAVVGSFLLTVAAAARGQWPVGFVRANLFLVPLLYVVAGIGAFAAARWAWAVARRSWPGTWTFGVLAFVAFWVVLAGTAAGQRMGQVRTTAGAPMLLGRMDALVAFQKARALPGDVQVVIPGRYDMGQWYKAQQYYARYDDGLRGLGVDDSDTLLEPPRPRLWRAPLEDFLARHPQAGGLFLVTYNLVLPAERKLMEGELARLGWCDTGAGASWRLTGEITYLRRCDGRRALSDPTSTAR